MPINVIEFPFYFFLCYFHLIFYFLDAVVLLIICLVCFNKHYVGRWPDISNTSMENKKFVCSLVEIYMLSIKVTLDHVIVMGLVITGSKLWSKLFSGNCWVWWCTWVLNKSKFDLYLISTRLLVKETFWTIMNSM